METRFDFSGWATRNDLRCSDGRTIRRDAFKHNDGCKVPLVWNHKHDEPENVLGHVMLKNCEDGVYAYGFFNGTETGQNAKMLVEHGDICALSIYANQLKQKGSDVLHGTIREVSLVLAGANPGAFIDSLGLAHSDDHDDGEAIIYTGERLSIFHADEEEKKEDKAEPKTEEKEDSKEQGEAKKKTVQEVLDTLNEDQQNVVYGILGAELTEDGDDNDNDEEDTIVKHNVFSDKGEEQQNVLSHSDLEAIFNDAKRAGSLKEACLQHGITDLEEYLFPEAHELNTPPAFIQRDIGWVNEVMNGTYHSPFSRIRTSFADITADEARARGYMKGNLKEEEVFTLLKRETTPCTVYKTQKMHRDDIIDIKDFDVVAWIKGEMRMMLNEELARAALIGDGRMTSANDKIKEDNIRPIWKDAPLFTINAQVSVAANMTADQKAKAFIRACVKARKNYKGSGKPVMFTTEDYLTDCLLMEDNNGRIIYDTEEKLAHALRVSKIITVPVMENQTRSVDGKTHTLMALIVNLKDYAFGADKGGAVATFDDFDIDYNRYTYLIETRCSGGLTKPYSAIAVEEVPAS